MSQPSGLIVEFDEGSHTYRVAGQEWPSVTQILSPLIDYSMVDPDLLDRAARFGRNLHAACHLDNLEMLDEAALDDALRPGLGAWRRFIEETKAMVISSECLVAHPKMRYAGTLDAVAIIRKRVTLIDIKTGALPKTVGPQTAAYAAAYAGPPIKDRLCVQITGDAYKAHALKDPRDMTIFTSCLNLHYWRQNNG